MDLRVVLLLIFPLGGFSWWPFSSSLSDNEPKLSESSSELRRAVDFEMATSEQKFLAEAQQFLDLSQLDQCQHLVITRLKRSCGEMSEEELGKLAVQLFNCQAHTEGRPVYTCTQDMSLADCTSSMDASTWNAYHIISNRARSVCYATRQQQFRRQTELAVNKLSQSTLEQLHTVQELAESHEQIKNAATESLETMNQHQQQLTEQQRVLMTSQESVQDKIAQNLEHLAQEKVLIHTGQQQLADMTHNIKQQLEEASRILGEQEVSRKEGQSEILEDITSVKENIQHIWSKVDSSTSQLLQVMEEMSVQYNTTLDNLKLINSSVSSMMSLVVTMDTALSAQLDWVTGQLGGAQTGLRVLVTMATHAAFLLVATLCVLFVKAPTFTRISLLVTVCVNALCEIKFMTSLTLSALVVLQGCILIGNWLYLWFTSKKRSHMNPPPVMTAPQIIHPPITCSTPLKQATPPDHTHYSEDECSEDVPETLSYTPSKPLYSTPVKQVHRQHSPMVEHKCSAKTRTGLQCKLPALSGSAMCRRHSRMN